MQYEARTPEEYISLLPEERKEVVQTLREIILSHLPEGFEETITHGMISYVVPHSIYPEGYHCNKEEPLPFMSVASQKNFIALYHMGIYSNKSLLEWFEEEYKKLVPTKLDMGKSCIRFKNMKRIPFDLIGKLCEKITVEEWIESYKRFLGTI